MISFGFDLPNLQVAQTIANLEAGGLASRYLDGLFPS